LAARNAGFPQRYGQIYPSSASFLPFSTTTALIVRFTKSEILEEFIRQDRSYRLAIISSHWLQGGTQ
jgi:hypothetical protein